MITNYLMILKKKLSIKEIIEFKKNTNINIKTIGVVISSNLPITPTINAKNITSNAVKIVIEDNKEEEEEKDVTFYVEHKEFENNNWNTMTFKNVIEKEFSINNLKENSNYSIRIKLSNSFGFYTDYSKILNIKTKKIKKEIDEFDAVNNSSKYHKINGKILTQTQQNGFGCWCTSFGKKCVSNGIYEWKVKINNMRYDCGIGIISSSFITTVKHKELPGSRNHHKGCFTFFSGKEFYWVENGQKKSKSYGIKLKVNDIVSVELNNQNRTLSFKVNNTNYGKALHVPKDNYRLSVSTYNANDKMEIV